MVIETLFCCHCGSINLRRDGKAPNGKQKYFCRDCKKSSRKNPTPRAYSAEFQAQVLAAYHERCSQRGVCRIFSIAKQTLTDWLKKAATLPPLRTTLASAQQVSNAFSSGAGRALLGGNQPSGKAVHADRRGVGNLAWISRVMDFSAEIGSISLAMHYLPVIISSRPTQNGQKINAQRE